MIQPTTFTRPTIDLAAFLPERGGGDFAASFAALVGPGMIGPGMIGPGPIEPDIVGPGLERSNGDLPDQTAKPAAMVSIPGKVLPAALVAVVMPSVPAVSPADALEVEETPPPATFVQSLTRPPLIPTPAKGRAGPEPDAHSPAGDTDEKPEASVVEAPFLDAPAFDASLDLQPTTSTVGRPPLPPSATVRADTPVAADTPADPIDTNDERPSARSRPVAPRRQAIEPLADRQDPLAVTTDMLLRVPQDAGISPGLASTAPPVPPGDAQVAPPRRIEHPIPSTPVDRPAGATITPAPDRASSVAPIDAPHPNTPFEPLQAIDASAYPPAPQPESGPDIVVPAPGLSRPRVMVHADMPAVAPVATPESVPSAIPSRRLPRPALETPVATPEPVPFANAARRMPRSAVEASVATPAVAAIVPTILPTHAASAMHATPAVPATLATPDMPAISASPVETVSALPQPGHVVFEGPVTVAKRLSRPAMPTDHAPSLLSVTTPVTAPVTTSVTTSVTAGTQPIMVANASPASDPIPVPVPRVGPAGQVFAAALHEAARQEDPKTVVDPALPAPVAVDLSVRIVSATADPPSSPLDLRQERWQHAMIDRIDQLRDGANATDTRIRLIPDALGTIDVTLRRDGEAVHVHLAADQPTTRLLLNEAQPRLVELAEARGLKLGQTSVDAGGTGQPRNPTPQLPQPSRPVSAPVTLADERAADTDTRIA